MKKIAFSFTLLSAAFIVSCGGEAQQTAAPEAVVVEEPKADPKGIGAITEVKLTDPMEQSMIASGKAIYEMKCSACHKLDGVRVVGPGFSGVTNRRRPEWIMNMVTNTDVMLDKDPAAQALLEECFCRTCGCAFERWAIHGVRSSERGFCGLARRHGRIAVETGEQIETGGHLEYHVYVGVIKTNLMRDGMTLNQVNGKNIKFSKDGDKIKVNNATIIASIDASNGVIHVIDGVLLPE
jgi:hypothetical protein